MTGRDAKVQPLDAAGLRALALRYVGKYATSEAKLRRYLGRKLFERGWAGEISPPTDEIVGQMAERGYVDDRLFAEARARGLGSKGFGARRVSADLGAAGIGRDLAAEVSSTTTDPMTAAIAFAKRRRFGPFGREPGPADPDRSRKQFAAMMRAGHAVDVTRKVLGAADSEAFDGLDDD